VDHEPFTESASGVVPLRLLAPEVVTGNPNVVRSPVVLPDALTARVTCVAEMTAMMVSPAGMRCLPAASVIVLPTSPGKGVDVKAPVAEVNVVVPFVTPSVTWRVPLDDCQSPGCGPVGLAPAEVTSVMNKAGKAGRSVPSV